MNPPKRNPLDGAKYREQYLSNLRLQASNNQKNQNANLIFKNTGQTPSQPTDMRTTTEKSQDIEGLKVDLRSKLGTITSGNLASQIIGELDNSQIKFAIDNWEIISNDMRRQFATGVETSPFIAYLNRLIQKFQLTEGVETGLQQSSGEAIIMSNTQILYGLPRQQIFSVLRSTLDKVSRQFGIQVSSLIESVNENEKIIITPEEIRMIGTLPPNIRAEINVLGNDIYKNLASNKEIGDLIGELNLGMANRDKQYIQRILRDIQNLTTLESSALDQVAEIRGIVADFLADQRGITAGEPDIIPESPFGEIGGKKARPARPARGEAPESISRVDWNSLGKKNKGIKTDFLNARMNEDPDLVLIDSKGKKYGLSVPRRGNKLTDEDKNTNPELDALFLDFISYSIPLTEEQKLERKEAKKKRKEEKKSEGKGMSGCGLAPVARPKVNKPYRQSIKHLMEDPNYERPKLYTQFGRYFINKHKLNTDNIAMFRNPSGNTIPKLPTRKVSSQMGEVLRVLVGKGMPTYEHISGLKDDEKNLLGHICKESQIDAPSIPKTKMLGAGQAEEDRFNILRGEIIAGNDNQKIAKEFKMLLLKFVNADRIPKRQANEILHELLLLGH
jgi:hypothetical protein